MPKDRPAIPGHEIRVVSISRDEYLADIERAAETGYRRCAADMQPMLERLASRLDAPALKAVLTTKEAADLAGVKTDTVRKWIRRGLPSTQDGNGHGHKIRRADLEAWMMGEGAAGAG